ncbi:hypothetical protein Bhyg_16485 [Pseudolycoriella hygida]|uniref:Arrestin-like N-terminal domain-containing protein n=1 Tax=Pseudolycoriella hygida TaxID=35572 RepID=A0A9Q0MLB4_9DIPT|nr:hypothetical protein Bhyg_16485 [Pseudolycoriella hygida]
MPPVGGFVALCAQGRMQEAPKAIYGNFHKVDIAPNRDIIKGKLMINFNSYRISHGGIKIRLEGYLEMARMHNQIDIMKHCPAETIISREDLVRGHTQLNFTLTIPTGRSYPAAFVSPNASITYRIVALILRDHTWEVFAKKPINFKGYYNVDRMELRPFVEKKIFQMKTGDVTSTLTVPNTVAAMGRLEGFLELNGLLGGRANATLTLLRKVNYDGNVQTETILSQSRQAEVDQSNASFQWTVVIPMMMKSSFSRENIYMYYVRYYLKYEVFLEQMGDEKPYSLVVNGIVEVEVGTTRGDNTSASTNHGVPQPQNSRRSSVMSLTSFMSMLSLPPAYSQLQSRSASMMSLETLPPRYDEVERQ